MQNIFFYNGEEVLRLQKVPTRFQQQQEALQHPCEAQSLLWEPFQNHLSSYIRPSRSHREQGSSSAVHSNRLGRSSWDVGCFLGEFYTTRTWSEKQVKWPFYRANTRIKQPNRLTFMFSSSLWFSSNSRCSIQKVYAYQKKNHKGGRQVCQRSWGWSLFGRNMSCVVEANKANQKSQQKSQQSPENSQKLKWQLATLWRLWLSLYGRQSHAATWTRWGHHLEGIVLNEKQWSQKVQSMRTVQTYHVPNQHHQNFTNLLLQRNCALSVPKNSAVDADMV